LFKNPVSELDSCIVVVLPLFGALKYQKAIHYQTQTKSCAILLFQIKVSYYFIVHAKLVCGEMKYKIKLKNDTNPVPVSRASTYYLMQRTQSWPRKT
jgi:hypothetical protein